MITTFTLPNISSMGDFVGEIVKLLKKSTSRPGAYFITLSGELGAGKTTLVQILAHHLGVSESVQSPTFVLAKSYHTSVVWPKRILHVDAYRLSGFGDLRSLDWEREITGTDTLILLEWPECVAPLSPLPNLEITLSVDPKGGRVATLRSTVLEMV